MQSGASEHPEVFENKNPQEKADDAHRGSHNDDVPGQFRVPAVHLLHHRKGIDRRRGGKDPDQPDKVTKSLTAVTAASGLT